MSAGQTGGRQPGAQQSGPPGAQARPAALLLALLLALPMGYAPETSAQPARAVPGATAPQAGLGWRWDAGPAPAPVAAAHAAAPVSLARRPPPDDPWLGQDKLLHAAGSFLIALSAQYVLTQKIGQRDALAFPVAAFGTFGLGLVKEVADSRRPVNPHFSTRDLVADAAGIALAGVVVAW